uniref:Mitochondrial carrier protein n=1 Tax=viral metagenome TaxID=1070528 RepID=A0A6C0CBP1_9ZZZZ
MSSKYQIMDTFKTSMLAASIAEIVTLPICTIKTIYQTNLNYISIRGVAWDVYRFRGIAGFYNSSGWAILSQTMSSATKFTAYSYLQTYRETQKRNLLGNMINGMISGIISTMFVHPIDVVKVHKQNNFNFLKELKLVGPKLFYRGGSKSLTKNIVLTSLLFPLYDFYKYHIDNIYIASACSAITSSLILHPIDYLKIRQISDQQLYPKDSGIRYYYRGFHINLMRVIPHFMITMVCIEYFRQIN